METPVNLHDDLRINIAQIENDLKHLAAHVEKIATSMEQMADMKAEMREIQTHLTTVIGNQHSRIDDLKNDVDCLGGKIRGVEQAVNKLEARLAVNTSKIGNTERIWWIIAAAVVGVISQFFKLKT